MDTPRVLVVGAGFAGFECARRLLREHAGEVTVTVVSPEDYLLYTPLLPDVAGGLLDPRHVAVPLAEALPGVQFVRGLVTSLDPGAGTATVAPSGSQDHPRTLGWDRLVLTPGSVTKLLDVPGLAERALGLKTLAEALFLRNHLLGRLEMSVSVGDGRACRACRTVVVVGASYAGTELVAQLRGLADDAARHHRFDPGDVRFVLLDVADAVMPEVGPDLGARALDVLRRRGVDVRLGTTLDAVDDDSVTLDDGSRIECSTVAWVTGVAPSPLAGASGLPLDEGGRLVVDEHLAVPGHPRVFAGGDAAAVPDLTRPGEVTPPTAQHATRQGRTLARNVAASLGRGAPEAYRHRNLGLVVDLGPGFAVANPLGVKLSGLPAKAVTRGYHLAALPRAANRAGVALDYLGDLFSSRPLVSLGLVGAGRAGFAGAEHIPGA